MSSSYFYFILLYDRELEWDTVSYDMSYNRKNMFPPKCYYLYCVINNNQSATY